MMGLGQYQQQHPAVHSWGVSRRRVCAELLKHTDIRTHVRAKFSRISAKFKLLKAELAKQAFFHIFGTI